VNSAPFDREIETRLKSLGYTVCASVLDGAQAIEKIPDMKVDLVMVYVGREGAMAAVEAAEEIHHRFDIPVICLIDSIEKDVLERIKQVKVLGHIFKPFGENQLCLGIEQQLHWHKLIHEAKERDELQRNSINIFGDAIISTDRRGLITFMNPAAESLTGWEMEEVSGKKVTDILEIHVGNEGNLKTSTILIEALQKRSVTAVGLTSASEVDNKTWIITKSGGEVPIDYSITTIKDQEANSSGIAITFRDSAKNKTPEEQSNRTFGELNDQHQLMKTVFDSMYDGIAVLSLTGHVLFVNPSLQRMFSTAPLEPVPSRWSETHGVFYPDKETPYPIDQVISTDVVRGVAVKDREIFVRNEEQPEGRHAMASTRWQK